MSDRKAAARSKRRGRGVNATGRSKRSARFVMLHLWMLDSPAWLMIGSHGQALYVALKKRFNGHNNGKIGMSVREAAAELRIAKDTASKVFKELEEKGFIRSAQRGNFHWKKRHASTWILTEEDCNGDTATKDFMRWLPNEKAGPKVGTMCPNPGTSDNDPRQSLPTTVPNPGPKSLN